ncbi:MAG: hypothetical protein NTV01_17720, partial [Bacteroidia bacterium]|nr:hypothetical protein [Bacteroidia bacterium]
MRIWPRVIILFLVSMTMIAAVGYGQDMGKTSRSSALNTAAVQAINEIGSDLEKLNESHQNLIKAVGELDSLYAKLARKIQEVSRLAADAKKSQSGKMSDLFKAVGEMSEMQMSFNLQYLMLQNKISQENRQFSMVSTIMKNKHDT